MHFGYVHNLCTTSFFKFIQTNSFSSGDLLSLKTTKISSRQKRRLVCFVARVQTYSVIQSAGTTPPSATRSGEFITPSLSLYKTKVVYP